MFFRRKSKPKPVEQQEYEPGGIECTDKIDAVMKMSDGTTALLMCALEEWSDKLEQLQTLNAKLMTYVTFVRSGQFAQLCPDAAKQPTRILLRCNYSPTDQARQVLEHVKTKYLDPDGIGLEVMVKPVYADPQA